MSNHNDPDQQPLLTELLRNMTNRIRDLENEVAILKQTPDKSAPAPLPLSHDPHFVTDLRVQLEGSTLWVETTCLGLDARETVLMEILIHHALTEGPGFLPVPRILKIIDKLNPVGWQAAVKKNVHDKFHTLRKKLGDYDLLVETGKPKNTGYRLSTPRSNIAPPRSTDQDRPGRAA